MLRRDDGAPDDDFVTKTNRSRKKSNKPTSTEESEGAANAAAASSGAGGSASGSGENISLRPRTMFTVKGRGNAEADASSSTYRPQWSKDGDGFVSNTPAAARDADTESRGSSDTGRRKGKVLRYTKEELLALHVESDATPALLIDAAVASEIALPPVDREPFDYDEVYKQWALNRNRGRGRGRTTTGQGNNEGGSTNDRSRSNGKWEEGKWDKSKRDNDGHENGSSWQKDSGHDSTSMWDDVGTIGGDSMEMDLSAMALAAEKFRLEMDAMRNEVQGLTTTTTTTMEAADMDAFDQKLEEAVKAGQFDDSDEEVQWDMPLEPETASRQEDNSGFFFSSSTLDKKLEPEIDTGFNLSSLGGDAFGLSGLALEPEVRDEWFYLDPQGLQQGPFKTAEMRDWFEAGYFKPSLPIQFGQGGVFTPLANHFLQGQIPFAAPPRMTSKMTIEHEMRLREEQRLVQLHQQQQQQRMLQLQHQQEQERLLQFNQEEKVRLEMQRMEIARQQLFQQQQLHQQQQQQQHALLQQQSSWQRTQREGIMSALGLFGGNTPGSLGQDVPLPFQQEFQDTRELEPSPLSRLHEASFPGSNQPPANDPWGLLGQPRQQDLQPQQGFFTARPSSPLQPSAPVGRPASEPVADPWGVPPVKAPSPRAEPVATPTKEKPVTPKPKVSKSPPKEPKPSPAKKQAKTTEAPPNAPWAAAPVATPPAQSLKDIQEDEQRELRQNLKEERSDLAQMGAQLKMMLGVKATAGGASPATSQPPQPPQPPAPAQPTPPSAPSQSAPTPSPWGRAAVAAPQLETKKSMREILEEEERLAIERAKRSETAGTASSHWMNVVAGTSAPAAPKVSRLGPVPASVLKSTTRQSRTSVTGDAASAIAAKKPVTTPSKAESDASFWNFGAAQASKPSSAPAASSAPSNFGNGTYSSEFMSWCAKQIKAINGSDDLTLVEYCATLEDPGEIREYLAAYLGSTPRVSAFATEFIQRKRSSPEPKKEQVVNVAGDSSDAKKGKRRTKGQKIDPSLLNYSVGS